MRTQAASRTCTLLDQKAAGAPKGAVLTSRCGPVVFVAMGTPAKGTRAFSRMLHDSGATLKTVSALPDCPKRTGMRGPLPAPSAATAVPDPPREGTVACLKLDGATGVVFLHTLPGVIGVRRIGTDDRTAWRGYGRDWPTFSLRERPLG